MTTLEQIEELKKQTKYREIIEAVLVENLDQKILEDEEKLLEVGWAHHQLGEYDKSVPIMEKLRDRHKASSEIGEAARRGLVHGLLQLRDDIEAADKIMQELPPGLLRDNARMNFFIVAARQGLTIPAEKVMFIAMNTLQTVPYVTINGHIVNNGVLALYEARQQEGVRPYLVILPALMFAVIGIYEVTGTAKNHIAGATFRASQICEAAGWKKFARIEAETSVELWRELVSTQDGARYQRNLEGAEAQLKKVMG